MLDNQNLNHLRAPKLSPSKITAVIIGSSGSPNTRLEKPKVGSPKEVMDNQNLIHLPAPKLSPSKITEVIIGSSNSPNTGLEQTKSWITNEQKMCQHIQNNRNHHRM